MAERLVITINCTSNWEAPPRHRDKVATPDKYSHITLPTLQEYANKVNADFAIVKDDHKQFNHPTPHFLIFECFNYFLSKDYAQMLYLDLDIVIKKNAPDIFAQYPSGFCVAEDLNITTHPGFVQNEYKIWTEKIFKKQLGSFYFNSGVILSDRGAMEKYMEVARACPKKIEKLSWLGGFGEQHMVNYLLHKSGLEPIILNRRFNDLVCNDPFFAHYIGHYKDMLMAP